MLQPKTVLRPHPSVEHLGLFHTSSNFAQILGTVVDQKCRMSCAQCHSNANGGVEMLNSILLKGSKLTSVFQIQDPKFPMLKLEFS